MKRFFIAFSFLSILVPSAYAGIAGVSREAFVDVPYNAYYYKAVEKLVTMNLVIDVDQFSEDEYFYPGKPLTRAEFIWWTVQLFGLDDQILQNPTVIPETPSFSDVPKTHPLYSYIEIAKKYRLIAGTYTADGKPTGKFEPKRPLIRAETAVILTKVFPEIDDEDVLIANPFSDIASVPWATNAIYKAYKLGLFSGYPDKTFRPGNAILRAEGITVLSKVFDKLKMATLSVYADACDAVRNAQFNSVEDLEGGLGPAGPTKRKWTLSFSDKEYTWGHTDVVEKGSYTCSEFSLTGKFYSTKYSASYDPRTDLLTWDGVVYEKK